MEETARERGVEDGKRDLLTLSLSAFSTRLFSTRSGRAGACVEAADVAADAVRGAVAEAERERLAACFALRSSSALSCQAWQSVLE